MKEQTTKSVFETLNAVNCNEHTEKKLGLTYLSWAWAWAEIKKRYPDASYKIYENAQGFNYHHDNHTCWVKTGVTINGLEMIEYLPVMDARNKSISLEQVTSFDVNRAIQRSLTKACARHGLGLYIYAGEDLPEEDVINNKRTAEDKLQKALADIDACTTSQQVAQIWSANKDLQANNTFAKKIKQVGSTLKIKEQNENNADALPN